jgi:hypothetical protein
MTVPSSNRRPKAIFLESGDHNSGPAVNHGRLDGQQVIPAAVLDETHRQQVTASGNRNDIRLIGYALGWNIGVLDTDTILTHGGGFSTFRTTIAFDPRAQTGVAVMAGEGNLGGGSINIIAEYVLRRARDAAAAEARYTPLLSTLPDIIQNARNSIAQDRSRRATRPQTLNHPLEAYAGTYANPEGGVMTWRVREGRLWAEIGVLRSMAEVFDHETDQLRVELEPGTGQVIQFRFTGDRATSVVYLGMEFVRR